MQIIEEMVLFKPDLVIFCAGFDAHDEDPLASCELKEEDFAWATEIGYILFLLFIHSPICLSVFHSVCNYLSILFDIYHFYRQSL